MRLLRFPIIKLCFFLVVGVLVGYYMTIGLRLSALITILLLGAVSLLCAYHRQGTGPRWFFELCSFLLAISIGVLSINCHDQKQFHSHYTAHFQSGVRITQFRVLQVLKSTTYYDKYMVDLLRIDDKVVSGRLLLNLKKDSTRTALKVDAVFKTFLELDPLDSPANPYEFDYKKYLSRHYIDHQSFSDYASLFSMGVPQRTFSGLASEIREWLIAALKKAPFSSDQHTVIAALLLGKRQGISPEIYTNYIRAGAVHLLAISGLHVGVVLMILNFLFRGLRRFKHGALLQTIVILTLLWCFAFITGLSASVTRATTMFSILYIGSHLKRPVDTYNSLALSVLILLLFKPMFLFDVGFQLSYLAMLGIIAIYPKLSPWFRSKYWVVNRIWEVTCVMLAAQIGVIPLSLFYFHQFPMLFFISNVLIVPLLGFVLGSGLLVLFLACCQCLPDVFALAYGRVIDGMNTVVAWVSNQNNFVIENIAFSGYELVASYLLIVTWARFFFKKNYPRLRHALLAILTAQLAVITTHYQAMKNEFAILHKNKHTVLINTQYRHMTVASDSVFDLNNSRIIKHYALGNQIKTKQQTTLKATYWVHGKALLIVDALGVYGAHKTPPYVLLRASPKINLYRLIDSLKPHTIIADGSNYRSYVTHWKNICKQQNVTFYDTQTDGAFIIKK